MRRSLIVEDILLIEPAYKNKYPPIGLMKIAYFHRYIMHDYVRFAKGRLPEGLENKKWEIKNIRNGVDIRKTSWYSI